ncbi:MAG: LpxI family protein [Myxococcota bacterium]
MIAGRGELPLGVLREAGRRGRPVVAVAFRDQTDPAVAEACPVTWLHPGEVSSAVAALREGGAWEAVMVGKVPKLDLVSDPAALRLDADALALLQGLADRKDDSILGALADFLEFRGVRLLPQTDWLGPLLGPEGVLGAVAPSEAQRRDLAFGHPIAKAIAGLDVGQTVIVKDGSVLAVEAIEGTDEAIRRAGALASGACVIKVAKPSQDPRFDVPTLGPETLAALAAAKASVLAYEAGCTLVLKRERVVALADEQGIAVVGLVAEEGA